MPLVTTYVATMENVEGFGPQVALEAQRRGLALAEMVLNISDGAAWSDSLAGQWRVADVRIIDYYHAIEHLHDVAEAVHGVKTPESWALWADLKTLLWEGNTGAVIARIERELERAGPAQPADPDTHPRTILRRNLGYFQKHQDHMKYPQYRAHGWPIGSGNTEAGVKCFNKRVKGTEQFWSKAGVEAIMALAREAIGKVLLIRREHVDSKMLRRAEGVDDRNSVAEANQNQRRIERHRAEGVDGQAVRSPLGIDHGGHGDTGGEAAAGAAEFVCGNREALA